MKNHTGNTSSTRPIALPLLISGLLAASTAASVIAAPGDHPVEPFASVQAQVDQPAGTSFEYLHIAGSTFRPLVSATTFNYPGNGCISKTGGVDSLFARKVVLPDGALVRFLRLFYYDDSTSSVTAFFTTYDAAGNFIQHTSVGSTDALGGYETTLSPQFGYLVDRYTASINVVANLGTQNNSTLRFCGVRIAYEAPITDRIFANGFDFTPL